MRTRLSCDETLTLLPSLMLQDFESNNELKTKVIAFLEEVMHDPELLTQERKAAANIIRYTSVGVSII